MRRPGFAHTLDMESATATDRCTVGLDTGSGPSRYHPIVSLIDSIGVQFGMMVQHSCCTSHASEGSTKSACQIGDNSLAWDAVSVFIEPAGWDVGHTHFVAGIDQQNRTLADAGGFDLVTKTLRVDLGFHHSDFLGRTFDEFRNRTFDPLKDPIIDIDLVTFLLFMFQSRVTF